ncbi:MAG: metallophosphoesterase [Thermaerobacter sp.]|nr:metallophosphoesterase [Thermaerobacter sp.]
MDYRVWHPDWPADVAGFTIIQLSDLHGRVQVFGRADVQRWLSDADLIAVTGDLYSPTRRRAHLVAWLERLPVDRTRFVSGNHDYRRRLLDIAPWDPPARVRLDNRVEFYESPAGRRLWLVGVPDLGRGRPAWPRPPADGPTVLLSHRPDAILAPQASPCHVVLAGHTHGGQVALPGIGPILRHSRLPRRQTMGLVAWPDGRSLVVSRGLGTSELPVRFGARPEVVRVRFVPPHSEPQKNR